MAIKRGKIQTHGKYAPVWLMKGSQIDWATAQKTFESVIEYMELVLQNITSPGQNFLRVGGALWYFQFRRGKDGIITSKCKHFLWQERHPCGILAKYTKDGMEVEISRLMTFAPWGIYQEIDYPGRRTFFSESQETSKVLAIPTLNATEPSASGGGEPEQPGDTPQQE